MTTDLTAAAEYGDEGEVTARVYPTQSAAESARDTLFNGLWLYFVVEREPGGYGVVERGESPTRLDYE